MITRSVTRPVTRPITRAVTESIGGFTLGDLFANGEQGAWYDISLPYLYQDSAGTTPVTGVEQPVGLVLDKSGNGYNATATVAATYKVDALGYRYIDNQSGDLSVTLPDLGVDCTVVFVTAYGASFLSGQAISGVYALPQADIYGYIVLDRGLTVLERASVETYYLRVVGISTLLLEDGLSSLLVENNGRLLLG